MTSKQLGGILFVSLVSTFSSVAMAQTTRYVPGAYGSIQSAIVASASGDTVEVSAGTYFEHIDYLGKSITVKGAGPGLSIIDGSLSSGPVVKFLQPVFPGPVLDGFTIRNGTGFVVNALNGPVSMGGGIFAGEVPLLAATGIRPTIRRCEVTQNTANWGAGIYFYQYAGGLIEDCHVHSNIGGGIGDYQSALTVIRRTRIEFNSAVGLGLESGPANSETWNFPVVEDCVIANNGPQNLPAPPAATYYGAGGIGVVNSPVIINRCQILNNQGGYGGGISFNNGKLIVTDTVIAGNTAIQGGAIRMPSGQDSSFVNCTFYGNSATSIGPMAAALGWNTVFQNCIIWAHTGPAPVINMGLPNPSPIQIPTITNSVVQGGWTLTPSITNIDVDPLLEDPANGDYRLRPDSPCINAGAAGPAVPPTDFFLTPRPLYGGVDMGFHECDDIALDPAVAGTVVDAAGQPVPLLTVNGQDGGALRRVDVAVGAPLSFGMALPPLQSGSADFVIFGMLGRPRYDTPVTLPFGLGTMIFAPCPLAPSYEPLVFTLASTVGGLPCTAVLPATPAPWSSGVVGSLPLPVTFGLQAIVVADATGATAVTNGIVVRVQ